MPTSIPARSSRASASYAILAVLCALSSFPARSQSTSSPPAFEVATIRANTSGSTDSVAHFTADEIIVSNAPLRRLLTRAYRVQPFQIIAPDFVDRLRFDVRAKYPPGTKLADRALMFHSLLEERFKLATHRESKEMPGYVLVVAKGGSKLQPAGPEGLPSFDNNGTRIKLIRARKTSIATLVEELSDTLGEMVIDQTGLDGLYTFEVRYTLDDQPSNGETETAPSLFTALQDTLGLRLQRQKVPVPMIVVDHIESVPTEN